LTHASSSFPGFHFGVWRLKIQSWAIGVRKPQLARIRMLLKPLLI
jgi:hypothetical protein